MRSFCRLWYLEAVILLFQLLAKHSSAALPYQDLLTSACKHVIISLFIMHHTHIISFAIINLFSLLNTRA